LAVRRQEKAGDRTYTVVDDLTRTYRALIAGTVRDEITGYPPSTRFRVQVAREDLYARTLDGGLYCLGGYPGRVFPDHENVGHTVDLAIAVPGYREVRLTVHVLPNIGFPVLVPDVQLRRRPIRIQGRVVTENQEHRGPVADAKIRIVDDPKANPPPTEHVVALRTPLHFDHAAGVSVHQRELTLVGSSKQLATEAPAGSRTLTLSNREGLADGDILGTGSDIQLEYALIESLAPTPADPGQPGDVTLRSALTRSLAADTRVQKVTPGPIGATRSLVREAEAGDGVLILDNPLDVDTIEIGEPTSQDLEYHALGALTDDEGFYRLDGVGRVRSLHMNASATGFVPLSEPLAWTINYERPVNVVDFRLSPL
jgi:hypothetical protein